MVRVLEGDNWSEGQNFFLGGFLISKNINYMTNDVNPQRKAAVFCWLYTQL